MSIIMNTPDREYGNLAHETIVTVLEKEIVLGRQIVHLLDQEREAIVKMDVAALIGFSNAKDELFGSLQEWDDKLRQVLEELSPKGADKTAALATLDALFQGDAEQQFQAMQREWRDLREKIVTNNLVNHQFIQETLSFLGDSVALFAGREQRQGVYGLVGRSKNIVNSPCVISREV